MKKSFITSGPGLPYMSVEESNAKRTAASKDHRVLSIMNSKHIEAEKYVKHGKIYLGTIGVVFVPSNVSFFIKNKESRCTLNP